MACKGQQECAHTQQSHRREFGLTAAISDWRRNSWCEKHRISLCEPSIASQANITSKGPCRNPCQSPYCSFCSPPASHSDSLSEEKSDSFHVTFCTTEWVVEKVCHAWGFCESLKPARPTPFTCSSPHLPRLTAAEDVCRIHTCKSCTHVQTRRKI